MAVFQHQARNIMLFGQLLQHVLRGGDGFALAADDWRGQSQMREKHHAKLLGRIDVEALAGQLENALADALELDGESLRKPSSTPVSMRTPACSMRKRTGASGRSISS